MENLFRPGAGFGPSDQAAYQANLAALAATITRTERPDQGDGSRLSNLAPLIPQANGSPASTTATAS